MFWFEILVFNNPLALFCYESDFLRVVLCSETFEVVVLFLEFDLLGLPLNVEEVRFSSTWVVGLVVLFVTFSGWDCVKGSFPIGWVTSLISTLSDFLCVVLQRVVLFVQVKGFPCNVAERRWL